MITFEQFLLLIPVADQEKVLKFKTVFFPMCDHNKGLPVVTLGFNFSFNDPDYPEDYWSEAKELIDFFKPLNAWIGLEEHRQFFSKEYPHITVEAYSFFGDSGYLPVSTMPMAMMDWFEQEAQVKNIEALREKFPVLKEPY